jgi:hypothetical protein
MSWFSRRDYADSAVMSEYATSLEFNVKQFASTGEAEGLPGDVPPGREAQP